MKSGIELIRIIAVILITFTHTRNNLESGIGYFLIEEIPKYGTAILSIVSGYLFFEVSRNSKKIFLKKIKTLAIPYLIANLAVLLMVLILNYGFGYNTLNRLTFNISLLSEGIFALNNPPINPPTYFIRDIFVIFSIIAFFTERDFKTLLIIIPVLALGTLILRLDIAFLFLLGCLYSVIKDSIAKRFLIISTVLVLIITGLFFTDYLKFCVSFLIFILIIDFKFNFINTGRFSYLLHLYHAPVMVLSYPIIALYVKNSGGLILAQILVSLISAYLLFLILTRYRFLRIISGGR